MKIKVSMCAVLFTCMALPCYANMSVYPMVVDINNQGEGSVQVISRTSDVQYIKTTIFNVTVGSDSKEHETEIKTGNASEIVVMPPKFALPAGANKMIRLVAMEPKQEETIYRVKFEAVPQLEDPLDSSQNTRTQLNLNLIWGVMVSVPPENPQLKMSLASDGKITNNGNQRFKILKIGLCKKSQVDKDCRWQDVDKNIYPHTNYPLKDILNYDRVVVQYWNWIDKSKHSKDLPVH